MHAALPQLFSPSAALLLAALAITAGCDHAGNVIGGNQSAPHDEAFARADDFVVYFDAGRTSALADYDVAFIDPDAQDADSVRQLAAGGTVPVGYLNVGEAESYRWFFDLVEDDWILGENPDWDDHYFIDARREEWRALLLDKVIPAIQSKGFEGLFLDMVNVALPAYHPETRPGVVTLVREIRRRYPDLLIVMNGGSFLMDDLGPVLDGQAVESVFARYDFSSESYYRTPDDVRDARVEKLQRFREAYDMKIFSIDYAPAGNEPLRRYAREQAREQGFLSYVSTLALDTIV